jgi:hypothetical protein
MPTIDRRIAFIESRAFFEFPLAVMAERIDPPFPSFNM